MKKQVSKEDLASLCLELSLLLHAGVGTGDALHLLAEEEESSRELLERLAEQVDRGSAPPRRPAGERRVPRVRLRPGGGGGADRAGRGGPHVPVPVL